MRMKSNKIYRLLGVLFSGLGIGFLLYSSTGITGFVVLDVFGRGLTSIWGLTVLLIGFLFFMSTREEGGLEKKAKILRVMENDIKRGKMRNYKDLVRYAEKLGYDVKQGPNHIDVYNGKKKITEIPRHKSKREATGTYRNILKKLYHEAA